MKQLCAPGRPPAGAAGRGAAGENPPNNHRAKGNGPPGGRRDKKPGASPAQRPRRRGPGPGTACPHRENHPREGGTRGRDRIAGPGRRTDSRTRPGKAGRSYARPGQGPGPPTPRPPESPRGAEGPQGGTRLGPGGGPRPRPARARQRALAGPQWRKRGAAAGPTRPGRYASGCGAVAPRATARAGGRRAPPRGAPASERSEAGEGTGGPRGPRARGGPAQRGGEAPYLPGRLCGRGPTRNVGAPREGPSAKIGPE